MNKGIYSAIFGSLTEQIRFNIITNNLANINSIGFKKDHSISVSRSFSSYLKDYSQVKVEHTLTDFSQGELQFTGNQWDIAIKGRGFLKVQTPRGIRFTRKGNLSIDPEGVLVTKEGFPVLGKQGKITLPPKLDTINIDNFGVISSNGRNLGQLDIVDFSNYSGLKKDGLGFFKTIQQPITSKEYTISQGYLEGSNVNVVEEMVGMIESLRNYESYQKVIQTFIEADHQSITQIGTIKT